jgi:hypothetical protein
LSETESSEHALHQPDAANQRFFLNITAVDNGIKKKMPHRNHNRLKPQYLENG